MPKYKTQNFSNCPYVVNGSFYVIAPTELRKKRSFFGANAIPLLIESPEAMIDIDSEYDFKIAEYLTDINLKQKN